MMSSPVVFWEISVWKVDKSFVGAVGLGMGQVDGLIIAL